MQDSYELAASTGAFINKPWKGSFWEGSVVLSRGSKVNQLANSHLKQVHQ
jgi:hypothetical protein